MREMSLCQVTVVVIRSWARGASGRRVKVRRTKAEVRMRVMAIFELQRSHFSVVRQQPPIGYLIAGGTAAGGCFGLNSSPVYCISSQV